MPYAAHSPNIKIQSSFIAPIDSTPPPIERATLAFKWTPFWDHLGLLSNQAVGCLCAKRFGRVAFYSERLFDTSGVAFSSGVVVSRALAISMRGGGRRGSINLQWDRGGGSGGAGAHAHRPEHQGPQRGAVRCVCAGLGAGDPQSTLFVSFSPIFFFFHLQESIGFRGFGQGMGVMTLGLWSMARRMASPRSPC